MKRYWLLAVVILAFVLRLAFLNNFPVGFTPDEASFGYDAYCLLKTGHDQWGKALPLVFESFGDYKSPLYAYITVPFVWLFGLSKTAVRLPNAILGSFAVWILYQLMIDGQWFAFKKPGAQQQINHKVAVLSSFLLAISPWHISMSRGAFEANLTTFFLTLGLYLFFKFVKEKKQMYLVLSALVLGLNIFSYHSARLITPLIVFVLIIVFRKDLFANKKFLMIPSLVVVIFVVISAYTLFLGSATRIADVSIFKLSLSRASSSRIFAYNSGLPDYIARLFHNKYQVFLKDFVSGYLSYFSPQFLFTSGAGETTYGMTPGRGVLYLFELPFLILFVYFAVKNGLSKKLVIVVFWLLVSPIPAALSIGPGYAANRAVIMLPALQIICAIGAYQMFDILSKYLNTKTYQIFIYGLILVIFISLIGFVEHNLFVAPQINSAGMLYGNLEAASYLSENFSQTKIVVSRKLSEPHIYVAFAARWDPKDYQVNTVNWRYKDKGLGWVDQMGEYRLGNYTFENVNSSQLAEDVIMVGRPDEFSDDAEIVKGFYSPSGEPLVFVVDSSK